MTTIETIKAANEAAGRYFFTEGTMAFFSSVIHPEIYRGRYFVSSEQAPGQPRRYTVREAIDGGADIGTLGGVPATRNPGRRDQRSKGRR